MSRLVPKQFTLFTSSVALVSTSLLLLLVRHLLLVAWHLFLVAFVPQTVYCYGSLLGKNLVTVSGCAPEPCVWVLSSSCPADDSSCSLAMIAVTAPRAFACRLRCCGPCVVFSNSTSPKQQLQTSLPTIL